MIPQRGILVPSIGIDINDATIFVSICRIAAKLALSIYYDTQAKIASPDSIINCQWTHAQQGQPVMQSVQRVINALPNQKLLTQGKWDTTNTFFLRYHFEDRTLFIAAVFHQTVSLMATLYESRAVYDAHQAEPWHEVMAPSPTAGVTPISL